VFQHILLPTDGSSGSQAAAAAAVRFAAQVGARVTALHVVPPLHLFTYEPEVTEHAHETYHRNRDARARECLAPVEELARTAGVACETLMVEADNPWEAILSTAHERGCDLVAMASHGRRGLAGVLLGSQTQRVLTHSAIPVLVLRGAAG
jgi:nucleotide-binding universal stress UspA family protein